jgi:hypothetical protein
MSRKIFISYRRADTADFTVALYNQLRTLFDDSLIFKDINTIRPGERFDQVLERALAESAVVLVIIGPAWISENGKRLWDPEDWVRQEVAQALSSNLRVVPLLVNGTRMPRREDLPDDLHGLCSLQALPIDNQRFEYDVTRLADCIQDLVPTKKKEPPTQGNSPWDAAFKAVILVLMLASIGLIVWAWMKQDGDFKERVFISLMGAAGVVGGWAAFSRQRWIELRNDQLKRQ